MSAFYTAQKVSKQNWNSNPVRRMITLHKPEKCFRCGNTIPVGHKGIWTSYTSKNSSNVEHINCPKEEL